MDLKTYVLGSELAQEGGFNISNISMLIADEAMMEGSDYLKYGTVTLINTESQNLPAYISKVIEEKELTDLSGYLPKNYLLEEVEEKTKLIMNMYTDVKICNKNFVKIKPETPLYEAFHGGEHILTICETSEWPELDQYIKGYVDLTKDTRLTWY